MKKLLFILSLLTLSVLSFSQGQPYPNYQPQGSPQTRWSQQGAVQAVKGLINGVYPDTATANIGYIDYYPGAQIFTTNDRVIWVRDYPAYRWIMQNPQISSFTFITDSSIRICFGNGVCDTITVSNFTNVVNNIIQNFVDSSVYNSNDSTLVICPVTGACDTINLGNTNTFNIFLDTTTNQFYLVTCDTVQVICVGDDCTQQQVCDTILIPRPASNVYQNLIWKDDVIVEGGSKLDDARGSAYRDTYYYLNTNQLTIKGTTNGRPPLAILQNQWTQLSSSIVEFHSFGAYHPGWGLLDSASSVKLRINYTDPFTRVATGPLTGDTLGFVGNRYGYLIMTNARGSNQEYIIDDVNAKQSGIFIDTYSPTTEAMSFIGNKVPSTYSLASNPATDTTLLDSRLLTLHLNQTKDIQAHGYPNTRNNGTASIAVFPIDANGTWGVGPVAGGSNVTIINDTTIIICSFGNQLCDTFIIVEAFPVQLVTIIDSTHLQVCDTLGNCEIFEIPTGPVGFDRGYFDPNQTSIGETRHQTAGFDFAVGRGYTLSPTGTSDNFLFGVNHIINANATRNFVAITTNTVSGSENTVFGRNMIVAGNSNFIGATDGTVFSTANYAAQFGDANTTRGISSLTAGFGNRTWAESGFTMGSDNVNGSLAANVGTANLYSNSTVLGVANFSIGNANFVAGSSLTANSTTGFISMFGKSYTVTTPNSFNVGFTTNAFEITANKVRINEARFQEFHGTTTAAANDLALPNNGNSVTLSGATTVNALVTTNWQAGSTVGIIFSGAPLLKHNTAGGAGTATMLLAGSVDFQAAAGDNIEFRYDGTNWHEIGRTLASGGGAFTTADNALTMSTATNVQLGATTAGDASSPLLHNTFINTTASYYLQVIGSNTSDIAGSLMAHNTNNGTALFVANYGGVTAAANAVAARIEGMFTSTNTVEPILQILRTTPGAAADGVGGAIEFRNSTAAVGGNNAGSITNRIVSKWVTQASTSQMDFNSGTSNTIMSAFSSGVVGIGISSAYTASRLQIVDNAAVQQIVQVSSSSTVASGTHRGVEVTLTGINANAGQTSAAVVGINTKTGSGAVTYGVQGHTSSTLGSLSAGVSGTNASTGFGGFFSTGGAGIAVEAQGPTTGIGVQGSASTSGIGVRGNTASGTGVLGYAATGVPLSALIDAATTNNDVMTGLSISRRALGIGADGIGTSISIALKTTTTADVFSNSFTSVFTTATHATRTSRLTIEGVTAGTNELWFTFGQSGSVKFRPMTVTEAGAIATAEGLMVFVSNTDATFTSVGLWIYQNGAWKAL